jgi:hypothetical protein
MSSDLSAVEKSVEEILIDLMDEKVMSAGIQASSTRGLQESPSTRCQSVPSRTTTEKRTKHHDDLVNAKQILSVLPDYILPLAGAVSHDNVSRDFEYTLMIAYLSKGIRAVRPQLGLIPALKISDFNLGDKNNYVMLAPHKYLMKTTGKKPNIVPQLWIKDIVRSMILNVMKIPHFDKHQEVNACIKILLSCYHGRYIWLDRRIIVDPALIHFINRLSMQGPNPQKFYPRKDVRSLIGAANKGGLW